jgi:hypothetical protein
MKMKKLRTTILGRKINGGTHGKTIEFFIQ